MKKYLYALVALALFAMPAQAGWNIKQKADGSAVWIDGQGVETPVGDSGLSVDLPTLATASTAFVISNKKGKIKKVYAIANTAASANSDNATLTIGISDGASATFTPISAGSTITMVTTNNALGIHQSTVPADVNIDVAKGGVISINTDGGQTGASTATIVIVIE